MNPKEQYWQVHQVSESKVEILLYGYIGAYDISANDFIRELKGLEKEYQAIDLRINSGGGNVFEGIAIYNALKASPASITIYIDGLAASMASVIALAGTKAYISRNAMMMTHPPSVNAYGNAKELKRNLKVLEDLEATMVKIYAERTGLNAEACRQKFLNGNDEWFTAQEAIEAGLADELYDAEPVQEPSILKDEKMAHEHYAVQIAAFYNYKNGKMNKTQMTAGMLAALELPEDAAQEALEAAIMRLAEKAKKTDELEGAIEALKGDLDTANNAFETYKKAETNAKITSLLSAANEEGRISVAQKIKLAAKYQGDYYGLAELIETMEPRQPITSQLGAGGSEVAELMAKTGRELFASGGFERLKQLSPTDYQAKWKEFSGQLPD